MAANIKKRKNNKVAVEYVPLSTFGSFENIGFKLKVNGEEKFIRVFVPNACIALYLDGDKRKAKKIAYRYLETKYSKDISELTNLETLSESNSDLDFNLGFKDCEKLSKENLDEVQIKDIKVTK